MPEPHHVLDQEWLVETHLLSDGGERLGRGIRPSKDSSSITRNQVDDHEDDKRREEDDRNCLQGAA